jgi:hypothetical protein
MIVQRTPQTNPTLAYLLPAVGLLGLAAALGALGIALQITVGAAGLAAASWQEAQGGIRITYTVAMYAGLAGVIALFLGMCAYALDLMGRWSTDDAPPTEAHTPDVVLAEREVGG